MVGKGGKLARHADELIGAAKKVDMPGTAVVKKVDDTASAGRANKQAKLRELVNDPNVSKADKGWIKQEMNSIQRGQRTNIRVPPGSNLAHRRGFEARKGFDYLHSDLQD